jgi:hypothetical protein
MRTIALTSHPIVLLDPSIPIEEIELKGRRVLVITQGVNPIDYQIGIIPSSGLPIPQVVNLENYTSSIYLEGIGNISLYHSGGKEIKYLPPPVEGVIYITSSFTAKEAYGIGRRDVFAPALLVGRVLENGISEIIGTIGLKLEGS